MWHTYLRHVRIYCWKADLGLMVGPYLAADHKALLPRIQRRQAGNIRSSIAGVSPIFVFRDPVFCMSLTLSYPVQHARIT